MSKLQIATLSSHPVRLTLALSLSLYPGNVYQYQVLALTVTMLISDVTCMLVCCDYNPFSRVHHSQVALSALEGLASDSLIDDRFSTSYLLIVHKRRHYKWTPCALQNEPINYALQSEKLPPKLLGNQYSTHKFSIQSSAENRHSFAGFADERLRRTPDWKWII
jgi:hypothetical protein